MQIDPKTIHEELGRALRPSAPSYTTVTRWTKRFREGRKDVHDHPRSASPPSEFTGENIELVREVISNDLHSTYDEIILDTSLYHGTMEPIIHDCLKVRKVTSRWALHQRTHEQKQQRVKLCRENLAKFQNEEEEEEEDTPAFRLPCSVRCCPRTVSIGPMLFLHLLLNVALDRRPA